MNLKSILCISLAAVTLTLGNQPQDGVQPNGDASYEFGYDIHNPLSNDIKSHHEIRDGKNVLGFYTFKEADGTIRIVKYKVGPDTGFEAVVEKIKPDGVTGNSIDGQEASPSTHGVPEIVNEPNGGHNSQYVGGVLRNPRENLREHQRTPVQKENTPNQEAQEHHHGGRYRNPYIIRRNPRFGSDLPAVYDTPHTSHHSVQNNHGPNQKIAQEARYVDVPRGRQRNSYVSYQQNHNQQLQDIARPRIHNGRQSNYFAPQVQPSTNNIVQPNAQPNGPIVYIDGIPYIDDIGAFTHLQGNTEGQYFNNGRVYVPGQQQNKKPHYEVQEEPEKSDEATVEAENNEEVEHDEDKEEYEDDDDDDDHAEYEEDDEHDDDEDPDATDFYEQNEKLINAQQEQYDRLKKAYEDDGEDLKPNEEKEEGVKEKEETIEEKPAEPAQE